MNGISFKGAVVSKSSNEYSPRILQEYFKLENELTANRNIPLDIKDWSWGSTQEGSMLVLWGKDYINFNKFLDQHKEEIPADNENWFTKTSYLNNDTKWKIRSSKLAAALLEVLNIKKADTVEEVNSFISDQNNLTNEVITEDSLRNALNKIKEST